MSDLDCVKIYGSGALSDGGVQPDRALDLGGFRSASEIQILSVFGAVPNVAVTRVGEDNLAGVGGLESDGAGNLRWLAPGESEAAPWVAVGDGEEKALPSAGMPGRSLRVKRSGAAPDMGARVLRLMEVFNGPLGLVNVDDATRQAGEERYRCLFLRNTSGAEIPLLRVLPQSGLKIAIETPVANAVQTIVNEHAAPVGLTWLTVGDKFETWNWPDASMLALWFWRHIAPGASASARVENSVLVEAYL